MKASTTTGDETRAGLRSRERARRTVVAVAIRDKALSVTLATRLTAARDAAVLLFPSADPGDVISWLDELRPEVLLLDEQWLHRLGDGSTPTLRVRWPEQRVLLVGDRACTALAEQVVRHRFQGFLLATQAADVWVKAVRAAKRGEMWVPRALLVELLCQHIHAATSGPLETAAKLTRREVEVIGYVRRGFANKHIGDALAIREDTVKKHLRNAYTKLGVHRRTEIITGLTERLLSR